ncbi:UvrD-helicase domain-containing protein [Candidatus Nitrosotenuis chungbukensis]
MFLWTNSRTTTLHKLELVKLIAKDGNVTAVGDDDQSIYRFQGHT